MYLIAKGQVTVYIIDPKKKIKHEQRTLRVGDYFGEISMLYGCKRTAECLSMKYSTLAKLTCQNFKDIALEYPAFSDQLKEGIYKYNDKQKKFLRKNLEEVEYFKGIGEDAMHDLMYNL